MEEDRNAFKILTGKPTEKRPLGRPRHRWEDIIGMDFEEIGFGTSTLQFKHTHTQNTPQYTQKTYTQTHINTDTHGNTQEVHMQN